MLMVTLTKTIILITARRCAIARYMLSSCVRPSVCLSIRPSQVGVRQRWLNLGSQKIPRDSPGTLIFWCQKSRRNSNGVTPNGGAKRRAISTGSAIADRETRATLCRPIPVQMLSCCCINNAHRSLCQPEEHFQQFPRFYIHVKLKSTVRVINRLPYNQPCIIHHNFDYTAKVVDNTEYSGISSTSWMQTTVADGHEFSAVRRLSGDFSTGRKTQFYPPHLHLVSPLG